MSSLLFERTSHERVGHPARLPALVQQRVYRFGDRQLDADAAPQLARGARRAHALGHLAHPAEDLVERAAAAQLDADVAVSRERPRAREDEVAEAGQPREGLDPAAHADREARYL